MLTQDELLVVLMEEAAEIIKEASKCLRSGADYVAYQEEGNTKTNAQRLSHEIGDLLGVVDQLTLVSGPICSDCIAEARNTKLCRMLEAKRLYGRTMEI